VDFQGFKKLCFYYIFLGLVQDATSIENALLIAFAPTVPFILDPQVSFSFFS
jgi:hypothetical protein